MADTPTMQIWTGRLAFVALITLIIFIQLLPLDTRPETWPVPDFMLIVTLAWTARRPDFAPVIVIATLFLLADLLFQRPPGLWAGLVVLLSEILRRRARQLRNTPILLEWGSVAFGILTIAVIYRIALGVTMTPQAPLGLTLIQLAMTMALYPFILLFAHAVFGVSRAAPGQTDSLGHRL